MILVMVQLRLIELLRPELTAACLASVRIHVIGMISQRSAGLAHQPRIMARMIVSFVLGPVLLLVCHFTVAAPELRLTFHAHFAKLLLSPCVLQHVCVKLETAKLLQALGALVLFVFARCEPSVCAAGAHEVSIKATVVPYHFRTPRACVEHIFASEAPVAVGTEALLPRTTFVALGALCRCLRRPLQTCSFQQPHRCFL